MTAHSLCAAAALIGASFPSALAARGEEWTVKPECAIEHKRFIDHDNHNVDLTTNNSVICQEKCIANTSCAVFTFYPDSKSCWLQTAGSALTDTPDGTNAIAGPKVCKKTTPTTTTTEEAAVFPWWGWLLIALGVLCCLLSLGLACYLMNQKMSNRKPKKTKRAIQREVPLVPTQAPVAAPIPVQYYTPVQTYAAPPVYVTSATPVTYAAPAPMTYTAPAPTTVTYATGAPALAGGSFVMAAPMP